MAQAWPEPDTFCLLLLGAGGPALALAGLLGRGRGREFAAPAAALAALAALAAVAGRPAADTAAALALAGACALFGVLRSERAGWLGSAALAAARRPRAQWLALLAAGPLVAAVWAWGWAEAVSEVDELGPADAAFWEPPALREVAGTPAATDGDRPVRLFEVPPPPGGPPAAAREEAVLRDWLRSQRLLRTGQADDSYNCHGWVFAAGRYWLWPADVEALLHDNAYHPVADPRPGDVAVYREAAGAVAHTGLVRAAAPGRVLVESKWGRWGRFLHAADDQPYGRDVTFYRTPRRDHTVLGVDAPEGPDDYTPDPGWLGPTTGRP
jgi:hypothetical protein